jgi:hypothetical protein
VTIAIIDSGMDSEPMSLSPDARMKFKKISLRKTNPDKDSMGTERTSASVPRETYTNGTGTSYQGMRSTRTSSTCACWIARALASTSILLAALNWILTRRSQQAAKFRKPMNKDKYAIRVVNMSSARRVSSYRTDPSAGVARALVDAGIVVWRRRQTAARDANGNKIYGAFTRPGNEPS